MRNLETLFSLWRKNPNKSINIIEKKIYALNVITETLLNKDTTDTEDGSELLY